MNPGELLYVQESLDELSELLSPKLVDLSTLTDVQSGPHLEPVASALDIVKIHIARVVNGLQSIEAAWTTIPGTHADPQDLSDLRLGMRQCVDQVNGFFIAGLVNGHDLNNSIQLFMNSDIYEVPNSMKAEASLAGTWTTRLNKLSIPMNTDIFHPIEELPEGTRVLVIEDDKNVINLVKHQVGDRGTVVSAEKPEELPSEGHFDLILLDWYWGTEIGGDYIDLLKKRFPTALIIGHSSSGKRQEYFGEIPACNKGAWFKMFMDARKA